MQIITNYNGSPKVKIEQVYQINIYMFLWMKKKYLNVFQINIWFVELNQYNCFNARYDHLNLIVRVMNSDCIIFSQKTGIKLGYLRFQI